MKGEEQQQLKKKKITLMASKEGKKSSLFTCKLLAVFFVGTYLLRSIFTAVYFKQIGLSSTYTGILQGASPIAHAIGGIILGYVADKADLRKIIFTCSYLAYTVTPFVITLPQPIYQCKEPTKNNWSNIRFNSDNQSFINGTQLQAFHHMVSNSNAAKMYFIDNTELSKANHESTYGVRKEYSTFIRNLVSKQDRSENEHFLNSSVSVVGKALAPAKTESSNQSSNYEEKLFVTELIITIFGDLLAGVSINLVDTLMVGAVEDKKQYGKVRLWGNIGQAVTIPSIAVLTYFKTVDICGISVSDFTYALYSASLISLVGWFITIFIVHFPSSKEDKVDSKHRHFEGSLEKLITPLETWSLLIISFFYGVAWSAITSFLFWTMVDLNTYQANLSIAVANFIRNAVSFAQYLVAPKLLYAVGYRNVLTISCVIYATAFVLVAIMQSTWLGTAVELFVGSAYALSMAACVSYIGEVAHPSLAVTAQGLLHFMYTGIGAATGPAVAGVILDYTGQTTTFLIFAAMCIVVMIFSIIVQFVLKVRQGDYQRLRRDEEEEKETSAEDQP